MCLVAARIQLDRFVVVFQGGLRVVGLEAGPEQAQVAGSVGVGSVETEACLQRQSGALPVVQLEEELAARGKRLGVERGDLESSAVQARRRLQTLQGSCSLSADQGGLQASCIVELRTAVRQLEGELGRPLRLGSSSESESDPGEHRLCHRQSRIGGDGAFQ